MDAGRIFSLVLIILGGYLALAILIASAANIFGGRNARPAPVEEPRTPRERAPRGMYMPRGMYTSAKPMSAGSPLGLPLGVMTDTLIVMMDPLIRARRAKTDLRQREHSRPHAPEETGASNK